MKETRVTYHPAYTIAPVDERIFGGFLEHMGRAVYEGVYEPQSKHADANGFRQDVLSALRQQRYTAMRYPGGNFASGYHWLDGVGPRDRRPPVLELAWQSLEPNQFGTDEFIQMARQMDWTPMITVNLGTGTPEEARNWVEYCNSPAGTLYANLRAANGHPEPYEVRLWCLGNEMDGPWQLGHVPAGEYAIRAQQAAKLMKDTDPRIELVVAGSCTTGLPTYMEWDRAVLEYVGPFAEYVSLHRYVGNPRGDTPDFLAVTNAIDRQIEDMDAACRYVQARTRARQRHYLCFDEWNVAYRSNGEKHQPGAFAPHLGEELYNLEDALVVAGFLNSFIRHADSIKIANLAQIVNVIPPILTRGDEMLLQSIYYPFVMYSTRRAGTALRPAVVGPGYESPSYGYVDNVDSSAILGDGRLHVFLTNRSLDEQAAVTVDFPGGQLGPVVSAEVLAGAGPSAHNTFEQPRIVVSRALDGVLVQDGQARITLPPLSVAAISFMVG
jgi:alpha-N-arabinofuranosidase